MMYRLRRFASLNALRNCGVRPRHRADNGKVVENSTRKYCARKLWPVNNNKKDTAVPKAEERDGEEA